MTSKELIFSDLKPRGNVEKKAVSAQYVTDDYIPKATGAGVAEKILNSCYTKDGKLIFSK